MILWSIYIIMEKNYCIIFEFPVQRKTAGLYSVFRRLHIRKQAPKGLFILLRTP